MVLRLKPSHTCDVISVVAEFMVDGAAAEARAYTESSNNSVTTPLKRLLACQHPTDSITTLTDSINNTDGFHHNTVIDEFHHIIDESRHTTEGTVERKGL
jgi:hypothetical protein